jgi:hypothetical protein
VDAGAEGNRNFDAGTNGHAGENTGCDADPNDVGAGRRLVIGSRCIAGLRENRDEGSHQRCREQ